MTLEEARTFLSWAWADGSDVEISLGWSQAIGHRWERLPYGDTAGPFRLSIPGTSYRVVPVDEVVKPLEEES